MAKKTLLVAFSTTRTIEGEDKRVRYPAGSVVDLTDDEETTLAKLEKATGKLHFRDPVNEGGKVVEDKPEVVHVDDFSGQQVPMTKKDVDQLKAYLDFHSVDYAADLSKTKLLDLAKKHEAGQTDDKSGGSGGGADDNGL